MKRLLVGRREGKGKCVGKVVLGRDEGKSDEGGRIIEMGKREKGVFLEGRTGF